MGPRRSGSWSAEPKAGAESTLEPQGSLNPFSDTFSFLNRQISGVRQLNVLFFPFYFSLSEDFLCDQVEESSPVTKKRS